MAPITKIWLFSLKSGHTTTEPAFTDLWAQTFKLVSSFTGIKEREQHVLFQCKSDKKQLVLVTGYPSLEMNREANAIHSRTAMKPMFEIVDHQRLLMLDADVNEMPLGDVSMTLSLFKDRRDPITSSTVGGWDVFQPPGSEGPPEQTTWVEISGGQVTESEMKGSENYWVFERIDGI